MTESETPGEVGWYDDPSGAKNMERYWNGEKWAGAPRKKPPQLTGSGIVLIVVGTIVVTAAIGLIWNSIWLG